MHRKLLLLGCSRAGTRAALRRERQTFLPLFLRGMGKGFVLSKTPSRSAKHSVTASMISFPSNRRATTPVSVLLTSLGSHSLSTPSLLISPKPNSVGCRLGHTAKTPNTPLILAITTPKPRCGTPSLLARSM